MVVGRAIYVLVLVIAVAPVAVGASMIAAPRPTPRRRWPWLGLIALGVAAACGVAAWSRPVIVASGTGVVVRLERRVELGARDNGTLIINDSSGTLWAVAFLPFEGHRMTSKESFGPGARRVAAHRIDHLGGDDDDLDPFHADDALVIGHTWLFAGP